MWSTTQPPLPPPLPQPPLRRMPRSSSPLGLSTRPRVHWHWHNAQPRHWLCLSTATVLPAACAPCLLRGVVCCLSLSSPSSPLLLLRPFRLPSPLSALHRPLLPLLLPPLPSHYSPTTTPLLSYFSSLASYIGPPPLLSYSFSRRLLVLANLSCRLLGRLSPTPPLRLSRRQQVQTQRQTRGMQRPTPHKMTRRRHPPAPIIGTKVTLSLASLCRFFPSASREREADPWLSWRAGARRAPPRHRPRGAV